MLGLNLGLGLSAQRAVFSPLSLNPVLLVDPSDTSTLFQDAAGTTPVTSAGDPVGLALDKSQGLARGVELITNGDFSNGTTGWSMLAGATLSAVSGALRITNGGGNGAAQSSNFSVDDGSMYELAISNLGPESVFVYVRDADGVQPDALAQSVSSGTSATFKFFVNFSNAHVRVFNTGGAGATCDIDDVSVKHLPGNHLTAPSDAARPTYQTGGGLRWLEFDGVDDQLEATTRLGFSANPAILVTVGLRPTVYNGAAIARVWQLGTQGGGSVGIIAGTLGTAGLSFRHNNGARIFENVATGTDRVISYSRQAGDTYGEQIAYIDGNLSAQASVANSGNVPTNTDAMLTIGSHGWSEYIGMRLYSIVFTGEHTATEQGNLERWTSGKSGVTL